LKILLLGKNGQVGWELQRSLAPLGELIALDARVATPAKRPHNSRLDTQKLRTAFDLTLPDWHDGVARMLAEIL
jgi:dTDP-4-dehydrorhamnose reductase